MGTWAKAAPRPLVVFLDEIDALRDDALISVLRQIRAGVSMRPQHFPWSLALIGLRDVRDYKVASGGDGRLGTASPFNIKAESLTLRNFSQAEVAELYGQHTTETGQVFLPDALALAYELTQGQPWLVSALARQLTQVLVKDRAQAITVMDVEAAKEVLIKVWRPGAPDPLTEGLAQLDGYMAGLRLDSGWLVIFNRRPDAPPLPERLETSEVAVPSGRRVVVVRA